jgi:hypothetical protein
MSLIKRQLTIHFLPQMTPGSVSRCPDLSARNNSLPDTFHDDTMEMLDVSTADHSGTQHAAYFTTPPIIDDPWAASIRTHSAEGSSVRTEADMELSFREETPVVGSLIRTHSEMEHGFRGEMPVAVRCPSQSTHLIANAWKAQASSY